MAPKESALEQTAFYSVTPGFVIATVEKSLDVQCSNLCRPLNSYINRVYELATVDGRGLIVKFYRPGRWSRAALQDEHDFLLELLDEEIPVVAPLILLDGSTLGSVGGIYFAVFPKKGGRSYDEYSDDQWLELGRLLGRTHMVGARRQPRDRITLAPDKSTRGHLNEIFQKGGVPSEVAQQFAEVTESIIQETAPFFEGLETIRIHGDCHFSNLIYRPGESFFIIDFDDMVVGPPVQDLWMLLPGYQEDSVPEIDLFLEGYETFRAFDRRTLGLIEPLRAMRYLHYMAWCVHQSAEGGLSRVVPDFGTPAYWQREVNDLAEQLDRVRSLPTSNGNYY